MSIPKKCLSFIATITWIAFFATAGLAYYVNHYLPHGPIYSTGEYVCQNDDRGPCGEQYKEDLRGLDIPGWAKFFRKDDWKLLWIALGIGGIILSEKSKTTIDQN